ncbi:MAG: D-alanyl-D-alanine carboxypeptidase [Oscillospiraceae bacterium]|nr:D-alanyl-D-alanine carboxypeptidase [Oscillospiraceae bacterium]
MISRELLRYDFIRKFTTTWTDSIRNGEFILNNTNKLVYHFPDTTGLKTGFTSKAGHCLAASARREETEFIAVVLSCESSASRFEGAKSLLNYAFSNYTLISVEELCSLPPIKVEMGKADCINGVISDKNILIKKDIESALSCLPQLPEKISAPIENGQKLGTVKIMSDNVLIKEIDVISEAEIASMAYFDLLRAFLASLQNFLVINAEL